MKQCQQLCECLGGEYDDSCENPIAFGVAGLVNFFVALAFTAALWFGCTSASKIIRENGGPAAISVSVTSAYAPAAVQMGLPVGPAVYAVAPVAASCIATARVVG